jgi:hypothetical protein
MAWGTRLVTTTAAAGGLLAASIALGGGLALAAPAPTRTIPAACGSTVTAMPGDVVHVTPKVGVPQDYTMSGSPGTETRIPSTMERPSCEVDVRMGGAVAPAPVYAPYAAAPMAPAPQAIAPGAVAPGAVAPGAVAPGALAPAAVAPAAPLAAPAVPGGTAGQASRARAGEALTSAPSASSLGALPSAPALAPPAPALAPVAPAAPADPSANVLPASDAAKLAAQNSNSGGLGVPVLVALIAGAGVAAIGVRMLMNRRSTAAHALPRHADAVEPEAPIAAPEPDFDEAPAVVSHGLLGRASNDEFATAVMGPSPSRSPLVGADDDNVTAVIGRTHGISPDSGPLGPLNVPGALDEDFETAIISPTR